MKKSLIILAALIIVVIVVVTVALSSTVSDKTLTASELDGINQACISCHEDDLTMSSIHGVHVEIACFSCHDNAHNVHASSDCQNCHASTAGLETADRAYTILKWVGMVGAGLIVIALAVNFLVTRRRLRRRKG